MSGYSREAEALARTMAPDGDWHLDEWRIAVRIAQRAIDAGWTPPPDPHEDIARELMATLEANMGASWVAENPSIHLDILAAVRRVDLRRGDQPGPANDRLRSLLTRAKDHIDPNDDQDAYDLWRECEEVVR